MLTLYRSTRSMLTVDEAEIVLGKVFLAKERRDKPVIKTVILSSADRSDLPLQSSTLTIPRNHHGQPECL